MSDIALTPHYEYFKVTPTQTAIETPTSIVVNVIRNGIPYVLKIPNPEADEVESVKVLNYFRETNIVQPVEYNDEAILLEKLNPATHLTEIVEKGNDNEATHIFIDCLENLHTAKGKLVGFSEVEELYSGFDMYLQTDNKMLSKDAVEYGKLLFEESIANQGPKILTHGDLHHDNILYDFSKNWVPIDPKGIVAEPEYDIVSFLKNPTEDPNYFAKPHILESRLKIIQKRLPNYSLDKIYNWSYATAVLSAIWSIECDIEPTRGIAMANMLSEIWDDRSV